MPVTVEATPPLPGLSPVGGKRPIARFDGGQLSSDGGLLALREVERRLGGAGRLAARPPRPAPPPRPRRGARGGPRGGPGGGPAAARRAQPPRRLPRRPARARARGARRRRHPALSD